MIKSLIVFLSLVNFSHAGMFNGLMFKSKTGCPVGTVSISGVCQSANVTCWWSTDSQTSSSGPCASGASYSNTAIGDNYGSTYIYKKNYYCPSITTNSTYASSETVSQGMISDYLVYASTTPAFAGLSYFTGGSKWEVVIFGTNQGGNSLKLWWLDAAFIEHLVSGTCTLIP